VGECGNELREGSEVCDGTDLNGETCEADEDCNGCPGDCPSGTTSGAVCGNGICEAANGEDCLSCAADCNGKQNGNPNNRFCCGAGTTGHGAVDCTDSRCTSGGFQCTDVPLTGSSFCCGDLTCDAGEYCGTCALDCSLGAEICTGGVDEDCDDAVDCDDPDCSADPACDCQLGQPGDPCTSDSDCCSDKCKGPPSNRSCR